MDIKYNNILCKFPVAYLAGYNARNIFPPRQFINSTNIKLIPISSNTNENKIVYI